MIENGNTKKELNLNRINDFGMKMPRLLISIHGYDSKS